MDILDKKPRNKALPTAKKVLQFIQKHSQKNLYFPSPVEIANQFGMKEFQAQRYMPVLVAAGLIEKVNTYCYRINKNARFDRH
jgi:DNA-binding IclR family transcriptional regulator